MKWRESWAARDTTKTKQRDDNTQALRSISGFLSCSQRRTVNWDLNLMGNDTRAVLEGTPSSEAALGDAHEDKDAAGRFGDASILAGRHLPRSRWGMSRKDAVTGGEPNAGAPFSCVGFGRGLQSAREPLFISPLRKPRALSSTVQYWRHYHFHQPAVVLTNSAIVGLSLRSARVESSEPKTIAEVEELSLSIAGGNFRLTRGPSR